MVFWGSSQFDGRYLQACGFAAPPTMEDKLNSSADNNAESQEHRSTGKYLLGLFSSPFGFPCMLNGVNLAGDKPLIFNIRCMTLHMAIHVSDLGSCTTASRMSTKNNTSQLGSGEELDVGINRGNPVISSEPVANALGIHFTYQPSAHPLDTTWDTPCYQWNCNGARELTPTKEEDGPCFSMLFLSPSPGRTLDRVYTAAGKVLETQANRVAYKLGLGSSFIAGKLNCTLGRGNTGCNSWSSSESQSRQSSRKRCLKLMKYSLPTESANTQCQAFKEAVDLATLFPGLRVLFLQTKVLDNATSLDTISSLWDQSTGPPDKNGHSGRNWLQPAWQILQASKIYKCTLPAVFGWSSQSTWVLADFGIHTCSRRRQVVLPNGPDAEGHWGGISLPWVLIEEAPVDYDGVDLLATTLLGGPFQLGLANCIARIGPTNHGTKVLHKFFSCCGEPRAAELLPCASVSATTTFEDILPTTYQDRVLNVMVDKFWGNASRGSTAEANSDFSEEEFSTALEHDPNVLGNLKLSTKNLKSRISCWSISKEILGTIIQKHWTQWKALHGYIMNLVTLGQQEKCGLQCLRGTRILGREDDPSALQVMQSLGVTHRALGQFKEAQEVMELALEKQREKF
ncbi:hypothetical protein B0H14DRAFT_2587289 [Mycena olivaceomarginata]|nr:hypothetical protein B0H14DRAFT_2587289 [Mycena olivaceomarginata]